jgi:hypothetical protein
MPLVPNALFSIPTHSKNIIVFFKFRWIHQGAPVRNATPAFHSRPKDLRNAVTEQGYSQQIFHRGPYHRLQFEWKRPLSTKTTTLSYARSPMRFCGFASIM